MNSLHRPSAFALSIVFVSLLFGGCGDEAEREELPQGASVIQTPDSWPQLLIPEDNPATAEKIELGRHLFYDTKLSGNETQSCASCHLQELSFTDGRGVAEGSTGDITDRGAMNLANIGYASVLNWGNPLTKTLEEQALGPMFGEDPVELGLTGMEDELLRRLSEDPQYPLMFEEAFPDDSDPINLGNITKALATFQRSLISSNSPVDRFFAGDDDAITEQELTGLTIFFGERAECFHCHGGFNFSDSTAHEGQAFDQTAFHNNGLYNVGGTGAYPERNNGVFEVSQVEADRGRFKAPTLRNIAVTAPYMHDGSLATLEDVLDHYERGGTLTEDGPNAGDGALHPNKSQFVNGIDDFTAEDRAALLAFLNALTDEEFLTNPAHSDPFER